MNAVTHDGVSCRHVHTIEVPHRARYARSDSWKPQSTELMKNWEWRLLLQIKGLPTERRRQIIMKVAEEYAAHITPPDFNDEMKADCHTLINKIAILDANES